jgi:hypothetical protein
MNDTLQKKQALKLKRRDEEMQADVRIYTQLQTMQEEYVNEEKKKGKQVSKLQRVEVPSYL